MWCYSGTQVPPGTRAGAHGGRGRRPLAGSEPAGPPGCAACSEEEERRAARQALLVPTPVSACLHAARAGVAQGTPAAYALAGTALLTSLLILSAMTCVWLAVFMGRPPGRPEERPGGASGTGRDRPSGTRLMLAAAAGTTTTGVAVAPARTAPCANDRLAVAAVGIHQRGGPHRRPARRRRRRPALSGLRRPARCYPYVDGIGRRWTPMEASVVTTAVKARSIPVPPVRAGGELTRCVPRMAAVLCPHTGHDADSSRAQECATVCDRHEYCRAGAERAVAANRRATT